MLVEPVTKPGLLALLAAWEPLDEDFPELNDPPPHLKNTSVTTTKIGIRIAPDHAM
jgi:hypothetical protein